MVAYPALAIRGLDMGQVYDNRRRNALAQIAQQNAAEYITPEAVQRRNTLADLGLARQQYAVDTQDLQRQALEIQNRQQQVGNTVKMRQLLNQRNLLEMQGLTAAKNNPANYSQIREQTRRAGVNVDAWPEQIAGSGRAMGQIDQRLEGLRAATIPNGNLSDLARLNRELQQGLITPQQFDIGMANLMSKGLKAPSGYRYTTGGNLQPIPGGPAVRQDPPAGFKWNDAGTELEPIKGGPADIKGKAAEAEKVAKKGKDKFDRAKKLRDEFSKQSKDFIKVRDAFGRIEASARDPSAAGDLALIFNYMKVLDPGSTVREGEFATAQNSGSVPDRTWNIYNRILTGQRLAPRQRADFVARAKGLFDQQRQFHTRLEDEYRRLATAFEVDPNQVIVDLNQPSAQQPATQTQTPGSRPAMTRAERRKKYGIDD